MKTPKTSSVVVRVWRHDDPLGHGRLRWPELDEVEMRRRLPVGVAFSGGGSRAYCASLGQLAALHQLGMLDEIRYSSAVSGGAWALGVYSFGRGNAQDAGEQLLGVVSPPSELSWDTLRAIAAASACGAIARKSVLAECARALVEGQPLFEAWRIALHSILLEPLGLPANLPFTYTSSSASIIRARNPTLANQPFATCGGAPYPLFGATLLGPRELAPFSLKERAFIPLEISPLYVGVHHTLRISHKRRTRGRGVHGRALVHQHCLYGGLLETFAFGSPPPKHWPPLSHSWQLMRLPSLRRPLFSLDECLAASSFFAGAPLASVDSDKPPPLASLRAALRPAQLGYASIDYWSPLNHHPSVSDTLLADGGSLANPPLISLLQRGLNSLICFVNVGERLPPASEWDPDRLPIHPDFSDDLPAFFGLHHPHASPSRAKWTERNAVFEAAGFAPLIRELQRSLAEGRGGVAEAQHTTVANDWWGIHPGRQVHVLWFYMVRAHVWESQLPADVRTALPRDVPNTALLAARAHPRRVLRSAVENARPAPRGMLDGFPQYPLTQLQLSYEQAAAVHQLSGWVVLQHATHLRRLLDASEPEREGQNQTRG